MADVLKGIAAYKADRKAKQEAAAQRDRPKANWFQPKQDEPVPVRFLQEVDEESENYDADRGVGYSVLMHTAPGPDGWKRKAKCTLEDEGRCFACEQRALDITAGWKTSPTFFINVLEQDGTVSILSRSAGSPFVAGLYEEAELEGSIVDKNFRINRTGTKKDTVWTMRALKDEPFDDSDVTLWNLEDYIINVPYDRQPKFYGVEVKVDDNVDYEEAGSAADW